jgi:hypothetical protein
MGCESLLSRRFLLGDQATSETIWNLQSMSGQGLARSSPEHGNPEENELAVGSKQAVNFSMRVQSIILCELPLAYWLMAFRFWNGYTSVFSFVSRYSSWGFRNSICLHMSESNRA